MKTERFLITLIICAAGGGVAGYAFTDGDPAFSMSTQGGESCGIEAKKCGDQLSSDGGVSQWSLIKATRTEGDTSAVAAAVAGSDHGNGLKGMVQKASHWVQKAAVESAVAVKHGWHVLVNWVRSMWHGRKKDTADPSYPEDTTPGENLNNTRVV